MTPANRLVTVLYTVFGFGMIAIIYFNPGPRFELMMKVLIATAAVFVAVQGAFRRDIAILVMSAGLGSIAVDAFSLNPIFRYLGFALIIGGLVLRRVRTHKTTTTPPRQTGA